MNQATMKFTAKRFGPARTQTELVLEYLMTDGNSHTALHALDMFRCFRLCARIWDIRQMGYDVEKRTVCVGKEKKHVAEYSLRR